MDGTILIMDCSSYERQKMRHIIEKTGSFNIVEVGGIGQFLLLNLEISDLKLILLDLAFPKESDGFVALKRIRSYDNEGVPVIIVTQSDKYELTVEALKYSVNDYIKKPYQVKRLESSIRSFVRADTDFHYNTNGINEIRMSFDDYIVREIKYSKRTRSSLSLILITTLQLGAGSEASQGMDDYKLSVFAIAAQKAKEALRATDTIILNHNRDIIIVLPCTDEAGAQLVCDKIKSQMEPEFEKINADRNNYIYPVYVTCPKEGDNFQMLMEAAFKKVSSKEMLEKIVSIPTNTRNYADKSYNKYRKWF
jgi:DNA-binding response OmpR family regulator